MIDVTLGKVPLVVLTAACVHQLIGECGGTEKAGAWLSKLADRRRRPIGMHREGQTVWIPPAGWTEERLTGYVLAHHRPLEAQFGPIARWGRAS